MNNLPSEIVHLILQYCSLETCVALSDTSPRFQRLAETVWSDKVRKRCPFIVPAGVTQREPTQEQPTQIESTQKGETKGAPLKPTQRESTRKDPTQSNQWRTCARVVISRTRKQPSLITLSEEQQDPLIYSLKLGMKTLNYILKMDIEACEGLIDTNNHVMGGEDMKQLSEQILAQNPKSGVTTPIRPDLSHVTFPEQGVHNFIHHPHPDFTFFSMLEPKGWFLYCAIDKNPLLPIFGPFAFSHPDSFRVFVYDGIVWADFDGAVLPFVVDAETQKVRFHKQKMIHGYPEQHGRAFVQGKGVLSRYLCNENGKRICDLKTGINYFLSD